MKVSKKTLQKFGGGDPLRLIRRKERRVLSWIGIGLGLAGGLMVLVAASSSAIQDFARFHGIPIEMIPFTELVFFGNIGFLALLAGAVLWALGRQRRA